MKDLTLSELAEKSALEKELTQLVMLIRDLEDENRTAMKKFQDGDYNTRASFKTAAMVIADCKSRQKEIKKHEKNCTQIRQKLKNFD